MRRGDLVTASCGLHINILLFFGVGGLTYTFAAEGWAVRFDPYEQIVEAMANAGMALLAAYTLWVVLEMCIKRSEGHESDFDVPTIDQHALILLSVFWFLSIVGRFASDSDVAKSSLGTILPVLRMFQYPIVVLVITMASRCKPYTFLFVIAVLALSVYQAFISPWRSDVIFLGGAVSLGLMLRGGRMLIASQLLLVASLLFLLPFANQKKIHYDNVIADPFTTFGEILETSLEERLRFVGDFWSIRINGLREAAFVSKGLAEGDISYRYGETYWEALQQLVPRVVWPDKPSFNQTSGFTLPREIGLLSWRDQSTSWGVNFYAEAIWNIGQSGLLLFVPLLFFLVAKLDEVILKRMNNDVLRWLVQGALFFMFIDCVGLVNMGTYLIWSIIIAVVIESALRAVLPLRDSSPETVLGPEGIRS
jgi:hypothetical protein